MTNKKKIPLIFVVLIFVILNLPRFSRADVTTNEYPFVYSFHLYYDNGQLFADRDFEFKYDLIAEPFVQTVLKTSTSYRGEVLNLLGRAVGNFQFDPTVTKGKISIKGPYFSDADKVNFYNDKEELLLTLSVSDSSVCNDDGTCNSDVGENYQNCPNDCPRPSPSPAYQPPAPSVWQNMFIPILVAVAVVVAALVIWIIIRRRRSLTGYDQNLPPPTQPTP